MKQLGDASFQKYIKEGLVVIDFYADWCGPCKVLEPKFQELADKHKNIKFAKINVVNHPIITRRFDVKSIPNITIFRDGELLEQLV